MKNISQTDCQNKVLTLPNLLSLLRLCMIPIIIHLYCVKKKYALTAFMLILSGITDVVDGWIARRFHMISNFGKAFDPVADKLTQLAVMICLVSRFRIMLFPLVILCLKELLAGVIGLITIRKTQTVPSARWHGKACTATLYFVMILHIVWYTIPETVSTVLILISIALMLLSSVLYTVSGFKRILAKQSPAS